MSVGAAVGSAAAGEAENVQILDAPDVTEILVRWYAGEPKAVVARRLGVDRKTVRTYVRAAERAGWRPGGPPAARTDWARLVGEWFPLVTDARRRQATWAEIDRHRERIDALLGTMPLAALHRQLRAEYGLAASLASLRRYVRANGIG